MTKVSARLRALQQARHHRTRNRSRDRSVDVNPSGSNRLVDNGFAPSDRGDRTAPASRKATRSKRFPFTRSAERGATLVITLVLIAAVVITAATLIQRTRVSVEGANVARHRYGSTSCADGAREMLLSRFRAFNVDFSELRLDMTVAGRRYTSGHFDEFNVQSVTPLAGSRVLVDDHTMGVANRTVRVGLGGAPYRIVVVCTDSEADRQTEVEFLVRFGL